MRAASVAAAFAFASLVNLAPVIGLLAPGRIPDAYGVAADGPDLLILLRHRAGLFGIVGALLGVAAFRSNLRPLAGAAGLFSMLSFAALVWWDGPANQALRRIAAVDLVASAVLCAGLLLDRRAGAARPLPSDPADAPCEIRPLGPDDAPRLAAMSAVFGDAFEDDAYRVAPPSDAYRRRLLAGDAFIALVAEVRGEIVGGVAAYALPKYEQERSEVYLYDLAVSRAHRRRGIATALIRELEAVAAARGAHVVFVQADAGDEPAVALYSKLGTREEVLHFDIAVPTSDAGES